MSDHPLTAAGLLKQGETRLKEHGIAAPRWEAEVLLAHALGWSRTRLYQKLLDGIGEDSERLFVALIEQRCRRIPLQYILGSQDFMGLSFQVDERVLIPRPETELLVERVLFLLQGRHSPRLADVGTGSGAIAVSVAVFHPTAEVMALDISPQALAVARTNALRHGVAERIHFLQGDLLQPLKAAGGYPALDGIVSNPPYIALGDMAGMEPEVRDYEPHLALVAGEDGLDYYRVIVQSAAQFLQEDGFIALEIGYDQGEAVMDMIRLTGQFSHAEMQQDYAGRDRIVWAYRAVREPESGGSV